MNDGWACRFIIASQYLYFVLAVDMAGRSACLIGDGSRITRSEKGEDLPSDVPMIGFSMDFTLETFRLIPRRAKVKFNFTN